METQRLLLYLALAFLGLIIYQTWIADYHAPLEPVATDAQTREAGTPSPLDAPRAPVADGVLSGENDAPGSLPSDPNAPTGDDAVEDSRLVRVTTDVIDVALDSLGGTIAEVDLLDYAVSIEQPDEPFTLVSSDPAHYLVAQSGLQSTADSPAPTHREPMRAEQDTYVLGEGEDTISVPFVWESGTGITVTKTFTFTRDSYDVQVDYTISNGSDAPYTVNQYRQLKRKPGTKDERQQFVNTYIGGVLSTTEDVYEKVDFGDMEDENLDVDATDGWVAMIQHYFATAWIPTPGEVNTAYTRHLPSENRYLIGLVSAPVTVEPGGEASLASHAYIGPKIQERLEAAAPHLKLTVDYGWLTIIAQPLFWLLKTFHSILGNWGFAIILVTFCIKAAFYKLSEAGYRSMARMKLLQPKMVALKEKHGDDRSAMGQATMELYKKEKVNPLGGCLPMIVQIPVFIALYWTLLESVELRQAPWILWIQDLSIRDPYFILPVLMAATMFFQQKLNPPPADPIQQKVFQFLPLIMGVFFAFFPAGLVLYWVVNNSLGFAQQYYITRHVLAEKPAGGSSARPVDQDKPGWLERVKGLAGGAAPVADPPARVTLAKSARTTEPHMPSTDGSAATGSSVDQADAIVDADIAMADATEVVTGGSAQPDPAATPAPAPGGTPGERPHRRKKKGKGKRKGG